MYNTDIDKKERQKIIAIATATAGLILALVVAIVVIAIQRPSENLGGEDNTSFTIADEEKAPVEEKTETEKTEASELGSLSTETETKPEITVEPTTDKMPAEITSTGPEDILPLALVLGALTTAMAAAYMKKAEK